MNESTFHRCAWWCCNTHWRERARLLLKAIVHYSMHIIAQSNIVAALYNTRAHIRWHVVVKFLAGARGPEKFFLDFRLLLLFKFLLKKKLGQNWIQELKMTRENKWSVSYSLSFSFAISLQCLVHYRDTFCQIERGTWAVIICNYWPLAQPSDEVMRGDEVMRAGTHFFDIFIALHIAANKHEYSALYACVIANEL